MKKNLTSIVIGLGLCGSAIAQTTITGPSSSQSPFFQPTVAGYSVTSVLTTTDVIGGYKMCGIPDGMGAYDNGNGTFTLFMNHEIALPSGVNRAHGSNGAFVSKWVINKSTLTVVSGADLMQNVNLWNASTSTYTTYNATSPSTLAAFSRFCSGDLPAVSAYYNSITGKGTQERIFMDGEENGNEGRVLGHIATGPNAGTTYELPFLGKFSCENACASPHRSDKTIVIGMDDSTPGQVYVYVGNKSTSGTEINKAGLTGGTLYGVGVSGLLNEVSASFPAANTTFSMVNLGAVQAISGTSLNTMSNNLGVTNFLRPEDGCWDPSNPRDFYFNTTNAFNSPSRLWRLRFNDIDNPHLGGTITAVLDGTEGQQMLDNMTIDNSGHILLCEDVGNNAFNGRILLYNIANDVLTPIGQHDPTRFISGGANFLTQDEETSGIVDVQAILGPGMFLFVTQAHFAIAGEAVEGGQLMAMYVPSAASNNPEVNVMGNALSIPAGNTAINTADNTDFGTFNTGSIITKPFVIQNTGTGALTISNLYVTGTNAGDFAIQNPPALPLTIAAGGSLALTVKFVPAFAGTRSATINIDNNDLNEQIYDFAIKGVGAVPEINVQGNNVNIVSGTTVTGTGDNTNYGTVQVNFSVLKSFVIQNTGTGTLTISGININGSGASSYSFASALPAFPISLAANASQTLSVMFHPTVAGTHTATINVASNDADEAAYTFVIEGKADVDVGIQGQAATLAAVSLYPNPSKDEATVKLVMTDNAYVSVKVYDLQGKLVNAVIEKNLDKGEQEISIITANLKNGEYFVQVTAGEKTSKIKMLVQH